MIHRVWLSLILASLLGSSFALAEERISVTRPSPASRPSLNLNEIKKKPPIELLEKGTIGLICKDAAGEVYVWFGKNQKGAAKDSSNDEGFNRCMEAAATPPELTERRRGFQDSGVPGTSSSDDQAADFMRDSFTRIFCEDFMDRMYLQERERDRLKSSKP